MCIRDRLYYVSLLPFTVNKDELMLSVFQLVGRSVVTVEAVESRETVQQVARWTACVWSVSDHALAERRPSVPVCLHGDRCLAKPRPSGGDVLRRRTTADLSGGGGKTRR